MEKVFFCGLLSVFDSVLSAEEYGTSDTALPTSSETVPEGSGTLSGMLDCGGSEICEGALPLSLFLRLMLDAANHEAPPSAKRQQAIII